MSKSSAACFWCRGKFNRGSLNVEHVIPQWALRNFPDLRAHPNAAKVRSCHRCNALKAGMPPALFASIRRDKPKLEAAVRHWSVVAQSVQTVNWLDPTMKHMIAYTRTEMTKPLPEGYDVMAHKVGGDRAWRREHGLRGKYEPIQSVRMPTLGEGARISGRLHGSPEPGDRNAPADVHDHRSALWDWDQQKSEAEC